MRLVTRFATSVIATATFLFACGALALAQIAPGVTQSAAHTANITGTVTSSAGAPVPGADIRLNGPAVLSAKSDAAGDFRFTSVPWGTYEIVVTSSLGTASRGGIVLNGDVNVAIAYQAQSNLQTIAHVSTTSSGAHINVTSSAITSVNPSDYAFEGNATWKQLFAQIPGVAVSGYNNGGAYAGDMVGAPQSTTVLSLNGALPYETSTTLDGMPLEDASNGEYIESSGGGLDLSNLPMNAFDTADVVRGPGANAPSIVDSVGGSFVLHPAGEVTADHFEFSASNDAYGGLVSNAKLALHLGKLSATIIYGINDSPGPLGTGKFIPAVSSTPATIGGDPVWGSTGGEVSNWHGVPNCYCAADDTLLYYGVQQSTAWSAQSGAVSLLYDITPSITAQVFYAGTTSRQDVSDGYYDVEFAPQAAVPPYSGSYAPSPPNDANYQFYAASAPYPITQSSSLLEEKITAFLGSGVLRLAALQYNSWDATTTYLSLPNGEYTLWGTAVVGPAAPGTATAYNGTQEYLTFPDESGTSDNWVNNRDLLASYALQVSPTTTAGISYVKSYYNTPFDLSVDLGGKQLYALTQSSAASATTNEERLHVDTAISDKLSVGLSWYFTNSTYHVPVPAAPQNWTNSLFPYNAPRLGAVWQASQNIAVRASLGGGYALPVLENLTGYSLACSGAECTETTGNVHLKPEESFGFDIGSDVRLQSDTVASLDLYRANLYGQFFTGTTLSTYMGLPLYINELGNLGSSRMEGINLDIHDDAPTGVYWRGTLGLTRAFVVSVPAGFYNNSTCPNTPCTNQWVIPGPNFNGFAEAATVPYTSASATLGYRWIPGRYFDLTPTYYGNNNIYNIPGAFVELDAHAGYAITKNISLLANFVNITGVYDAGLENFSDIGYSTPVVKGSIGYWPGAHYIMPYGPRTVIVTANFKY